VEDELKLVNGTMRKMEGSLKNIEEAKKKIEDEKMQLELHIADIVDDYKNKKIGKKIEDEENIKTCHGERNLSPIRVWRNYNVCRDCNCNNRFLSCLNIVLY
jgi:hypothetical protein